MDETPQQPTAGAPEGNQNRMKWKTPEERIAACEKICQHLKLGKPKQYIPIADWDTIERYMKDFPIEFPAEVIAEAERAGRDQLLSIGYKGMLGQIPGFNAKTWQFIIQNMTHFKLKTDITTDGQKIESPMLYIPAESKDK